MSVIFRRSDSNLNIFNNHKRPGVCSDQMSLGDSPILIKKECEKRSQNNRTRKYESPDPMVFDSKVCTVCVKLLPRYLNFVRTCEETEKDILKYCEQHGTNSRGLVTLKSVTRYSGHGDNLNQHTQREDVFFGTGAKCVDVNNEVDIKLESIEYVPAAATPILYKCETCEYRTKYKDYLKDHQLLHRNIPDKDMYKCKWCSYKTKLKKIPQTTHYCSQKYREVEVFACETCEFRTKYRGNLTSHLLVHKNNSEVDTYQCNTCEYTTKYRRSLESHFLIHKNSSDVQLYICAMCDFKTKFKRSLKCHVLTHKDKSEVDLYACKTCKFKTKHRRSLARHLVAHKTIHRCETCKFKSEVQS
ncbi:hypothetical protein NQ317_019190 [Molorchus minor]|uniref:Protein hunchback n=1 Tax=Molorchus minor TaxID=1323400 RepID=A0ABQ9J628_9CUCU|nr:hypothetical protein NQ317_019190 [Molorchus minor]